MQALTSKLEEEAKKLGLHLDVAKTKIMTKMVIVKIYVTVTVDSDEVIYFVG